MQSLSPRWQRGSGCGSAVGRHSWVHTLPPFPSNHGQGFPAAPRLSTGKAWQVKLGEGCQNPVASDLLSSKHKAAAFPSLFLLLHCSFSQSFPAPSLQLFPFFSCPFTACSKMRSQFATCHPPCHLLAPSSTFTGQGCRAAEGSVCSRQWEGSVQDWMLAPLPPSSSQARGFSSAISVLEPALPFCAPHAARGASRERERQKGAERIETRR